ncbi:lysM and putative peptidoglycan-binding domain-containing protein 2 isoform X1 [Equus przewalskii]|uniref:LysM and putative peptidoglycan-binding domain-containing protein 2 isoform X1 n=1 Tax=Equus przewalskii TaxID=9798 RepID=A0ABM4L6Y3_EQUPR
MEKPSPAARGGQETAPSLQRPGGLQRLRSRSAGRGTHTGGRPPPAPPSAALSPAPPAGPGRQEAAPAPRARPPARPSADAASILQPAGRARGCRQRLARAGSPSPPGALTGPCGHPGAVGAGRPSVSPEGAGPAEQGRRRGRGERGDQQAAPGQARRRGVRLQRGRLGSVVPGGAPRPRGGGTPPGPPPPPWGSPSSAARSPGRCPRPESACRPRDRSARGADLTLGKKPCRLF